MQLLGGGGFLDWILLTCGEVAANTRHSQYQYYIQLYYIQLYTPAAILHGKEPLLFIGWATAVLVMNMADLLSAD